MLDFKNITSVLSISAIIAIVHIWAMIVKAGNGR